MQGKNRDTDVENRLVDTVAEGEERVRQTESSTKTYTLPYVKQIADGKLLITQGAQPSTL